MWKTSLGQGGFMPAMRPPAFGRPSSRRSRSGASQWRSCPEGAAPNSANRPPLGLDARGRGSLHVCDDGPLGQRNAHRRRPRHPRSGRTCHREHHENEDALISSGGNDCRGRAQKAVVLLSTGVCGRVDECALTARLNKSSLHAQRAFCARWPVARPWRGLAMAPNIEEDAQVT